MYLIGEHLYFKLYFHFLENTHENGITCTQHYTYMDKEAIDIVDLCTDARRVDDKLFDGIHMVERHKQDITRSQHQRYLILECHCHQIIELSIKESNKHTVS